VQFAATLYTRREKRYPLGGAVCGEGGKGYIPHPTSVPHALIGTFFGSDSFDTSYFNAVVAKLFNDLPELDYDVR
jgi:hypothetical protein